MTKVPYYGMFSDLGNLFVQAIVTNAENQKLSWLEIFQQLHNLAESDPEMFGEATDTMVREIVYEAYEKMAHSQDPRMHLKVFDKEAYV
jgi:hypothetical protein